MFVFWGPPAARVCHVVWLYNADDSLHLDL